MVLLRILAVGVGLFAIGFIIPRWLIGDGIARFRDDPARRLVAQEALSMALVLNDNPIARLALPGARVLSVDRAAGHCPSGPGSDQPYADYQARVRFHTWFGIPAGSVEVTCGGWSAARAGSSE